MSEYTAWEAEVNRLMVELFGVGVDDIPDMPYRAWFNSGVHPADAVQDAIDIVNEGGF